MQEWQKICSHFGVSAGSNGMPKHMGHSKAHGPSCRRERLGGAAAVAEQAAAAAAADELVPVVGLLVDVDVVVDEVMAAVVVLQF